MKNLISKILVGAGPALRQPKIVGGVVIALLAVVMFGMMSGDGVEEVTGQLTTPVQRGSLTINLVESGALKPRKQIVIKNDLDDDSTILYIVPEGKLVEEGELLVELDVTELENDVVERRIRVQNNEAALIHAQQNMKVVENQSAADIDQAELNFRFAGEDFKKYEDGEFPKLIKEAETKITLSKEELNQAIEELKWSKILFEEKYLSQSDLQADELSAQRAQLDLELAQTDLDLLMKYTYPRQIAQLKSDLRQAEMALEREKRMADANKAQATAQLAANEAELKEETDRLGRFEKLLPNAKRYAPIRGMVLYASSVNDRWRRDDDPIEVGKIIRERDEIIYLPTASEFNIEIKVSEVDLGKVSVGMSVKITVDSMPDSTFSGKVASISQLPDAESRYLNPNLKLYKTVIELDQSDPNLRNGMSCLAEISIAEYEDALYLPIQTVTRIEGQPTVYVKEGNGQVVPRGVEIGFDNSRFIRIKSGVEEGEAVLLSPPLGKPESEAQSDALAEPGLPGSAGESARSNS